MASELMEGDLYNGKYHMVHNPNARGRAPRYKVNETLRPKGVTTILNKTLAKDFVSWALGCMAEVLGEKLPIITQEDIEYAKGESNRRRDSGAGTGSEAHLMIEQFLKGLAVTSGSEEATNAFRAFTTWFNNVHPEVVNVEATVYSEEFNFAGTYDCMLRVDGKLYLCDVKTTNSSKDAPKGIYADMYLQMGAYALAHDEQREYELANGGSELLEVEGLMLISCKKNGKLDVVTNDDIGLTVEDCKGMFKRVVNIFKFMEYTTNKIRGK